MRFLSLPAQGLERLLVMDNVDDPKVNLSSFLPKWKRGSVIVTSRNDSHGQLSTMAHLQLDVMSKDESIELLVRGSGRIQLSDQYREVAENVAEELGYLPIALVQAASYIFRTGCSANAYISLLRTSRERVLSDPATSQIDMRYTTAFAAFDASYSILPSKAQQTLHLLSFFHRQKFPVECIGFDASDGFLFDSHFLDRGDEYERGRQFLREIFYLDGKWDPAEVESIISSLRSHSLVTLIPTETTRLLQLHSLVHEWARLRVPSDNVVRFQDAAIRLLCCNAQESNYQLMQYLQIHVHALSPVWEKIHVNDIACMSHILKGSGDYSGCLKLREHILVKLKNQVGVDHPATILASANLAATYSQLGRCAEAEGLQIEVLKRSTEELGVEDLSTIQASANLASIYGGLGRYTEAVVMEEEVLKQRTRLLGINNPDTILASTNLAATYTRLGRYSEAEVLQLEVLKQSTKSLGVGHPDTILASANLAYTYGKLGRYAEAESLEVEVWKRRKMVLGDDHPDTIRASANLAATYGYLGRYAEAETLQLDVLKQRTKLLGVDHPDTITASANLAVIYAELGRYVEEEVLELEVLEQRTKLLGADHPDTIRASSHLAGTYSQLGKYDEVERMQNDVLQRRMALLGDRHPDTLLAMWWLASTYVTMERYSEALELTKKVHCGYVETLGENHPQSLKVAAFLESLTAEDSDDSDESE